MSWTKTKFGTAETFDGRPGIFYSHQYDEKGCADVLRAATDYIETVEDPATRAIAHHLLDIEGVETDLYQRQSNERWMVDAQEMVHRAAGIYRALTLALKPATVEV